MKVAEFIDYLEYDFENHPINDSEQMYLIIETITKLSKSLTIRELLAIIRAFPGRSKLSEISDDLVYDFLSKQTIRGPYYCWDNFAGQLSDVVLNDPQLRLLRDYIYRGVSCQRLWQSNPQDKLTWAMDSLEFVEEIQILWNPSATVGSVRIRFSQEKIHTSQYLSRFSRVIRREILALIECSSSIYVNVKTPELFQEIKNQILRKGAISDKFVRSLFDNNLQELFISRQIHITHN